MRLITCSLTGLLVFSMVFVGSSFSGEVQMSEEMTGSKSMSVCWDTYQASALIGLSLNDSRGDFIGRISDLAIDPSTGRIDTFLVTDLQGFGAEEVAIPFSDISRQGESTFVYNPPEERHRFYGEAPYWSYGLHRLPMVREGDDTFSMFLGADVESREGEYVALIDDFVINSADGHVVYVVLRDVGGPEGKMVAVPYGALSKKGEYLFALDTTKEALYAATDFKWSDTTSARYASDIHLHYGLQPYWEMK